MSCLVGLFPIADGSEVFPQFLQDRKNAGADPALDCLNLLQLVQDGISDVTLRHGHAEVLRNGRADDGEGVCLRQRAARLVGGKAYDALVLERRF